MVGGAQGAPGFDGRRLRAARQAAQLTQRQVAHQLGLPETAIANWETGQRVPRVDRLADLAHVLGVRPTTLTSADGEPSSLQQLRVEAGLLQEQVAGRAGLTRTKYAALERGEIATLTETDAEAIAGGLGVPSDEVRTAHSVSCAAFLTRQTR